MPPPGFDLANDVIESIVSMTEQRDQNSLEQSLLTTLEEMLSHAEGWLIDLPAKADEKASCTMLHGDKDHLPRDVLEQGCHLPGKTATHLVVYGGLTYLLVKLDGAERNRLQMIVLAKNGWSEVDLQLVQGMVRVYQNFISVLYDSEKDTLTGLYNRRRLDGKLKEIANARLQGRRHEDRDNADYLCMLDLDRFKRINDTFGHLIGDEVLLIFANILRKTLRDSDLIFRYGGEEFLVLLQDVQGSTAREVLERVRRNVENYDFPQVGKITVSIGYAAMDNLSLPTLTLEKSDRALYYAKEHGRNQVCDFGQLVAEGQLVETHQEGSIELF